MLTSKFPAIHRITSFPPRSPLACSLRYTNRLFLSAFAAPNHWRDQDLTWIQEGRKLRRCRRPLLCAGKGTKFADWRFAFPLYLAITPCRSCLILERAQSKHSAIFAIHPPRCWCSHDCFCAQGVGPRGPGIHRYAFCVLVSSSIFLIDGNVCMLN